MFNKDVLERVVATFAQSFLAVFTIGDMGSMKAADLQELLLFSALSRALLPSSLVMDRLQPPAND